ncbi:hypothetical protein EP837_03139 [Sphingobium sp. EP60837]|jgi:hypothetical protein|nr:hypothetical protein EP837_03139 [Sphingobium sp. EP60837]
MTVLATAKISDVVIHSSQILKYQLLGDAFLK